MTEPALPVLGAALPVAALPDYQAWLLEGGRDLELQDPFDPDVLDGDWRPLVRRARELLDGHRGRLGVHGPFDGLTLLSRDPKMQALVTGRLRQALELAGELGATHMVVHSPFIFFGGPFLPHSGGFDQERQIELIHRVVEPVLPTARDAGCALVVEGIQDKNTAPWLALIRSFGSEYVRASVDVGHAYITHTLGGPPPDGWVREAGALLEHVHLQDTDGQVDRHWAPGDGAVNWHALFEALASLPHRPRLILEVKQKRDVRRGADWLIERGLAR